MKCFREVLGCEVCVMYTVCVNTTHECDLARYMTGVKSLPNAYLVFVKYSNALILQTLYLLKCL